MRSCVVISMTDPFHAWQYISDLVCCGVDQYQNLPLTGVTVLTAGDVSPLLRVHLATLDCRFGGRCKSSNTARFLTASRIPPTELEQVMRPGTASPTGQASRLHRDTASRQVCSGRGNDGHALRFYRLCSSATVLPACVEASPIFVGIRLVRETATRAKWLGQMCRLGARASGHRPCSLNHVKGHRIPTKRTRSECATV